VSNSPDSVLADLLRRFDSRRPLRRHFNTVVENAIAAHGDLSIPRAYYSAASVYLAWGSGERVLGTDSEFVRYRPRLSQNSPKTPRAALTANFSDIDRIPRSRSPDSDWRRCTVEPPEADYPLIRAFY
jgi:hypothetical protein